MPDRRLDNLPDLGNLASGDYVAMHRGAQIGRARVTAVEADAIPDGSASLDQLRWNDTIRSWEAHSGTTQTFGVLTPTVNDQTVVDAINHWFENTGSRFFTADFGVWSLWYQAPPKEATTMPDITTIWPDGGPAPYMWILTPNHTDWIGYIPAGETGLVSNYAIRYWTNNDVVAPIGAMAHAQGMMEVVRSYIRINGTSYDIARVQIVGPRPDTLAQRTTTSTPWATLHFTHTAPPTTGATVSIIPVDMRRNIRPDSMPPMLLSAALSSNKRIRLTFSELLDPDSTPAPSAFTVRAGPSADRLTRRTVTNVSLLNLAPTTMSLSVQGDALPISGDLVFVGYRPPRENPLRDLAHNPVAGFTNIPVSSA